MRIPRMHDFSVSQTEICHCVVRVCCYDFSGGSKEIKTYADIGKFRQSCGTASVMLARAAEWDPSIFRPDGRLPLTDVIQQYIRYVSTVVQTNPSIVIIWHLFLKTRPASETSGPGALILCLSFCHMKSR